MIRVLVRDSFVGFHGPARSGDGQMPIRPGFRLKFASKRDPKEFYAEKFFPELSTGFYAEQRMNMID